MMMKNKISLTFIFFIVLFFSFYMIDLHISKKYFCAYCDFDDQNGGYLLFYFNDSSSGYHSDPTKLNLFIIAMLSVFISGLVVKKFHSNNVRSTKD